nr:CPBP family intramembrane glutamic endopeptidase [Lolliginicoccus lacisalsi]
MFHIPVGTVLAEELLFRSALDALWRDALPLARHGRWPARLAGAATFGAWHVAPARCAGHSVGSTVLVTMLGGVVFTSLTSATSSVVAPAVVHYAMNAGGALIVHMVDANQ